MPRRKKRSIIGRKKKEKKYERNVLHTSDQLESNTQQQQQASTSKSSEDESVKDFSDISQVMPSCAAANCTNNPRKGYRLYTFPRDVERRRLWAKICGRLNWEPTVHSKLCEVHFEENQFSVRECDGRRFLKPNSIPTLFTNPDITENGKSQENMQEETPESFLNYDSSTSSKDLATMKQKKIHKLQKTVKNLRQKVKQINSKLQSLERSLNILQQDQVGNMPLPLKNMPEMIELDDIQKDQYRQQWSSSYLANSNRIGMMPSLDFSPFKANEILGVNGAYNIQYQLQNDSMDVNSADHSEHSKFPSSDEEYSNEIDEYDLQQARINMQQGMHDTTCLFMCEVCYQTYPDSNSLEKHHDLHTADALSDNDRTGEGENSLRQEIMNNLDLQDFVCKLCDCNFNNADSLNNHLKIHNKKASLACDSCSKQFKTTAGLNKHKKTHSLEKPHICTLCTMRFKRMYHLKRHLKTHYKNKECDTCNLKFKTERDLKVHKKKHTGCLSATVNNTAPTTTHACIIRLKKDLKSKDSSRIGYENEHTI